jgi:Fur family transcriptional regulator, ferric uptake regulator
MVADALAPDRPRTAEEVLRRLRREDRHIGRATVFRALDRFVEAGLARRLEMEGHVYGYVTCEPEHHHHLLCTNCGRVEPLPERYVEGVAADIRRDRGFSVDDARLDFYGRCADCRAREQ